MAWLIDDLTSFQSLGKHLANLLDSGSNLGVKMGEKGLIEMIDRSSANVYLLDNVNIVDSFTVYKI